MLLEGRRLLITGVRNEDSLAFAIARLAQENGAEVVLTAPARAREGAEAMAQTFRDPPEVLEFDVTVPEHVRALRERIKENGSTIDGVLHAIAFGPRSTVTGDFLDTPWEDVATAIQVSAFSLKVVAQAVLPFMRERGGQIVSLDFDARWVWPNYSWMAIAKSALETTARYLAWRLGRYGITVNLVAAGPIVTASAAGVQGAEAAPRYWDERAPLGWSASDRMPTAKTCMALFAGLLPATTGEQIHVDGGYHVMG
ncbi:MAG: enoyl-ACP reductase FabI [Solirubrobacterales bacterium]|nr:enoyl-ACP reductase FabI [Solirubrobacterales bacterium]